MKTLLKATLPAAALALLPAALTAQELPEVPVINTGDTAWMIGVALLAGIVLAVIFKKWADRQQMATGKRYPVLWVALALIVVLPIVVYFLAGMPLTFEYPKLQRFGPRGGLRILPEFIALLLALVIYTAAFIAEIVRAGIQAVSHGQTEASHALGLRAGPTLRLVIIPQALRVIIPPLTSQYLNLTKNSSLAIAIGYMDLVATLGGITLMQTGREMESMMLVMVIYLALSLAISAFMNWYNARVKLVER